MHEGALSAVRSLRRSDSDRHLLGKESALWACSAHRVELDRHLTGGHQSAMCEDRQPSLL